MRSKALQTTIGNDDKHGQDRGLSLRSMRDSLYLIKKTPSYAENLQCKKRPMACKASNGLNPGIFQT